MYSNVGVERIIGNYDLVTLAALDVYGALWYIIVLWTWPLDRIEIIQQVEDSTKSASGMKFEMASEWLRIGFLW